MTTDPVIPPPLPEDNDVSLSWWMRHSDEPRAWGMSPHVGSAMQAIIRRCHAAEQSLAAIRETLRCVPCPECADAQGDPSVGGAIRFCVCRGTGTRDIIDSLTTEEAVGRALKELNEEADFAARASIRDSDRIATVEAERDTLAARLKQAEELLRHLEYRTATAGDYDKIAAFLASEARS